MIGYIYVHYSGFGFTQKKWFVDAWALSELWLEAPHERTTSEK